MSTTIITKHSNVAKDPQPSDLERAEIAIDLERRKIFTKDSTDQVIELGGSGSTGGGSDSSVHIGEAPPADPQEGQQWMEVPASGDATMWIYDGGKWLQQPGGKDGAPGADGNIQDAAEQGVVATWDSTANSGAGQWTPDGAVVVKGGNVGIGTTDPAFALSLLGSLTTIDVTSTDHQAVLNLKNASAGYKIYASDLDFRIDDRDGFKTRITIQGETGNVGIGGAPGTSTADEYLEEAERAIGGGDAKLQVSGDGYFTGTVTAGLFVFGNSYSVDSSQGPGFAPRSKPDQGLYINNNATVFGPTVHDAINLGTNQTRYKNLYLTGSVVSTRHGLSVGTRDLIETLSTLRNATKDETTLEGLRDAIGNAVGGLIEKFEAMQSTATQEISDE